MHRIMGWFSGEWMIRAARANGGAVIFFRAAFITVEAMALAIGFIAWADPERPGPMSWRGLWEQIAELGNWIGPIFGGVYLALYARFAAQWTYIAGMYNQIMTAAATGPNYHKVKAQWAAAFIEDADNLHLALKSSIAPVILAWKGDVYVREMFVAHTPGGEPRWSRLMKDAADVYDRERKRQEKRFKER